MPNYEIPTVSQDMYQSPPTNNPLQNEDILSYVSSRPIEYSPYPLLYIDGATHPMKGWYEPQIIAELNIIKALILQASRFPLAILVSNKAKLMTSFNMLYDKMFHYTVNETFMLPAAHGFYRALSALLTSIGFSEDLSKQFAYRFAHVINYDDAYRYRLQDILSETTYFALQSNPRKELKRLITILDQRTPKGNQVANKLKRILTPASFLLILPRYKRAFQKAMTQDTLSAMQYDQADRYWASLKGDDYLFTGHPYHIRTHNLQIPQAVKVTM